MASTGQVYGTAYTLVSETPWSDNTWDTTPGNVTGSPDSAYALVTDGTFDSGDQSWVLKVHGFDFSSIPAGAVIDGVIVRLKGAHEQAGAGTIGLVQLLDVNRAKGGTNPASVDSNFPLTSTPTEFTFGSSTDKWGLALTRAWVLDTDFGAAIGMWARGTNTDVALDAVSIEVYYTESYGIGTPTSLGTGYEASTDDVVAITGVTAAVGTLIVVGGFNDGGPQVVSVTDEAGNTYTAHHAGLRLADNYCIRPYSCVVETALSNNSIFVTFASDAGTWDMAACAIGITGDWDANRLDELQSGTGTLAAWSSGATATTEVASELLIGICVNGGGGGAGPTSTPTAPWNELHDVDASNFVGYTSLWRIVDATGAYTAQGTWSFAEAWGAYILTFKQSAGLSAQLTGVASASSIGTMGRTPGGVSRTLTGVASASAIGTMGRTPGNISAQLTGVPSASEIGEMTTRQGTSVQLTGVASAAEIGTITATPGGVSAQLTGVASASEIGTMGRTPGNTNVQLAGVPTASLIGTITTRSTVQLTGVPSAAAIGTITTTQGGVSRTLTGVASAAQIGTITTAAGGVNVQLSAVPTAAEIGTIEGFVGGGTPQTVNLTGVASASSVGTFTVAAGGVSVQLTGVPSAAEIGTATTFIDQVVQLTGVPSVAEIGTITAIGNQVVQLVGVPSASQIGTITIVAPGTFNPYPLNRRQRYRRHEGWIYV